MTHTITALKASLLITCLIAPSLVTYATGLPLSFSQQPGNVTVQLGKPFQVCYQLKNLTKQTLTLSYQFPTSEGDWQIKSAPLSCHDESCTACITVQAPAELETARAWINIQYEGRSALISDTFIVQVATPSIGKALCWGFNRYGQLGNGNNANSSTPVQVLNIGGDNKKAIHITSGSLHTCAVLDTGAVQCWGNNYFGQLGNGNNASSNTPIPVVDIDGSNEQATAITAGGNHSCALLSTGTIQCWGKNHFGQLGNGSSQNSNTPVTVVDIGGTHAKAVAIATGLDYTCALLNTNAIKCWGYNGLGQLGDGNNTNSYTPVPVTGIDGNNAKAIAIAAAEDHACALLDTGAVKCWGLNMRGQLGNGNNTDSSVPVQVIGIDGHTDKAIAITGGSLHTCALLDTGAVKCWGLNSSGQLGNGNNNNTNTPSSVLGIDGNSGTAIAMTGGSLRSCALLDTGTMQCWGHNAYGQLGHGNLIDSNIPVSVKPIGGGSGTLDNISSLSNQNLGRSTCVIIGSKS